MISMLREGWRRRKEGFVLNILREGFLMTMIRKGRKRRIDCSVYLGKDGEIGRIEDHYVQGRTVK